MLTTSKVTARNAQPRPVDNDLVCPTRQELYLTWTGPLSTAGTLSAKQIVDTLAGTSSVWDKVQFKSFDVYGATTASPLSTTGPVSDDWPSITVSMNSSGVTGFAASDKPTFYSDSVKGQRRAHVHIRPNHLFTESWIDATNTEPLFSFVTEPVSSAVNPNFNFSILLQFTCVLRSTVGTFQPTTYTVTAVDTRKSRTPPAEFVVTVGNTPLPVTMAG